jgi:protein-S-isoprenylcysteine O-methyltransferase Ste14
MFTTGSKLFIGGSVVAVVAAIVFGVSYDGAAAWSAAIGLISVAIALLFLMGINFWVRDSNVGGMQSDATTTSAAAQGRPGNSMWPAIGAVGAGLVVVGLVATPVVFKAGVVVLLIALFEWLVQAWADRASADKRFNAAVRGRIMHPLEFPVLGAVGLTVIIYSFSRIMLFLSKEAGPAVFVVVAALITVGGFLFASKATLKTSVIAGICTMATLGLVSTGAVMAIDGEREMHEHPTVGNEPAVCASNEETEADERGSQGVAAKSNVAATIIFNEERQLYAQQVGTGEYTRTVTLARSNRSNIMFRNLSDEAVRLTVNMGSFQIDVNGTPVTDKPVTCTTLVEPDGRQFMSLIFPKSSAGSAEPYTFVVPDVEGATVEIVVP